MTLRHQFNDYKLHLKSARYLSTIRNNYLPFLIFPPIKYVLKSKLFVPFKFCLRMLPFNYFFKIKKKSMKSSKIIILAILCSMIGQPALFSQVSFSHSIGASLYASTDNRASAVGATYSPRLNVLEINEELTVSVGTHLGFGLDFNSREGANSLALDIPLMVELNFGNASQPGIESNFGGFVGFGYGISKIGSRTDFVSFSTTDFNEGSGLVLNAGLRLFVRDIPIGVRFSYLANSKKVGAEGEEYADVYSLGVFYTIK